MANRRAPKPTDRLVVLSDRTAYRVFDDGSYRRGEPAVVANEPALPLKTRLPLSSVKNPQNGKTMVQRQALFGAFRAMIDFSRPAHLR